MILGRLKPVPNQSHWVFRSQLQSVSSQKQVSLLPEKVVPRSMWASRNDWHMNAFSQCALSNQNIVFRSDDRLNLPVLRLQPYPWALGILTDMSSHSKYGDHVAIHKLLLVLLVWVAVVSCNTTNMNKSNNAEGKDT